MSRAFAEEYRKSPDGMGTPVTGMMCRVCAASPRQRQAIILCFLQAARSQTTDGIIERRTNSLPASIIRARLNLVAAAIVLWNTIYLERTVEKLRALRLRFSEDLGRKGIVPHEPRHAMFTTAVARVAEGPPKSGTGVGLATLPVELLNLSQ